MEIEKKDFNKLKQLDRIEYRQKQDRIKNWNNYSYGLIFIKYLIFIMVVSMLLIPQGYFIWGIDFVKDVSNICGFSISLLMILSAFGFMADIVLYLIKMKNLDELNKKYFKLEIKK